MLKLAVLVSGGGTNLQAIIDAISAGKITNACISVVISNNANAYALERARAHGIEALCIITDTQDYYIDLVFYNYLMKCPSSSIPLQLTYLFLPSTSTSCTR